MIFNQPHKFLAPPAPAWPTYCTLTPRRARVIALL